MIAASIVVPVFAMTAGCKSTATGTPASGSARDASNLADTSDASIAARVKNALSADAGLRTLAMSVAAYRGQVHLSGYVDSEQQIRQAVAIASGVPGVQSVSHDLLVRAR